MNKFRQSKKEDVMLYIQGTLRFLEFEIFEIYANSKTVIFTEYHVKPTKANHCPE